MQHGCNVEGFGFIVVFSRILSRHADLFRHVLENIHLGNESESEGLYGGEQGEQETRQRARHAYGGAMLWRAATKV